MRAVSSHPVINIFIEDYPLGRLLTPPLSVIGSKAQRRNLSNLHVTEPARRSRELEGLQRETKTDCTFPIRPAFKEH